MLPSLLIALSTPSAQAATFRVPEDEPTIAAALGASASNDLILINEIGTDRVENFTVPANRQVTIAGGVAQAGWTGTMTVSSGALVTIEDVVVRGGYESNDPDEIELGIYCNNFVTANAGIEAALNSTVIVDRSEFLCFADSAIYISDSNLTVNDSLFIYNQNVDLDSFGGAIYADGSGDVRINTSDFEINRAGTYGGAVFSTAMLTELVGNRFYANNAIFGAGGGAWVSSPTMNIHSNSFENNYSLQWWIPGLVINDPEDLIAFGGDIAGLAVGVGDGAGLYVEDPPGGSDLDIWDNLFCGNLGDSGSGVFINDVPGATVENNVFSENWSFHYGGGLYVTASRAYDPLLGETPRILNNTFLVNTAGKIPPPYPDLTVAIGAGASVTLDGTLVDFRNNVVAQSQFGGAILGVDGPDYTIGDLLGLDYNIFFWNCDVLGCVEDNPTDWQHFTGDMAQFTLTPTNLELDPFPLYHGAGEFNCFPDAFYPEWGSPAVRNGDPTLPNKFSPAFSDIGAFGGERANVLDRDGDGFENIYDCNDDPDTGGIAVFPGAPETCDLLDNNCDGQIDEGFDTEWYTDADGDGFGDASEFQPTISCDVLPNSVHNNDDCDDTDPTVNPQSPEICDGQDNDCDDIKDGGLTFLPVWDDLDEDLYGDTFKEQKNGCEAADGNSGFYVIQNGDPDDLMLELNVVSNSTDCNDANPNVNPGSIEVCDSVDNDCDGTIDNAIQGGAKWFPDGDGDGFGAGIGESACSPPTDASVAAGGDCDDFDPSINPGAEERCDGIDNDCDGLLDREASDAPLLYEDLDNDGLGNPATAVRDCNPGPSYTTAVGGDCDDNDPTVGECAECGCQAVPTPGSAGGLLGVLGVLVFLRRRRSA